MTEKQDDKIAQRSASAPTDCSDIYFRNSHGVNYRAKRRKDGSYIAQKRFLFWWVNKTHEVASRRYMGGGIDEVTFSFEPRIWDDADEVRFDIDCTDGLTEIYPNKEITCGGAGDASHRA